MKKLLLIAVCLFAAINSFAVLQYEMVSTSNPNQSWSSANEITLKITSGGSLWFSNYASNWYNDVDDFGKYMDMSAGKYGAVSSNGTIQKGTGKTQNFTFTKEGKKGTTKTINTTGYYVGNFEAGDEISFWITKNGVLGSSVGDVNWVDGVGSRVTKTTDVAGNTRFNFGMGGGAGNIEFIAIGGEKFTSSNTPEGKPLPGVFGALLLSGATFGIATWRRRKI